MGATFDYAAIPDYTDGNALGFFNGIASNGCDVIVSAILGEQSDPIGPSDVYFGTVRPRNKSCLPADGGGSASNSVAAAISPTTKHIN